MTTWMGSHAELVGGLDWKTWIGGLVELEAGADLKTWISGQIEPEVGVVEDRKLPLTLERAGVGILLKLFLDFQGLIAASWTSSSGVLRPAIPIPIPTAPSLPIPNAISTSPLRPPMPEPDISIVPPYFFCSKSCVFVLRMSALFFCTSFP